MPTNPPTIIDGPGDYETRAGEKIKITSVGKFRHACKSYAKMDCVGTYPNGVSDRWTHQGFIWRNQNCDNDIVKKL